MRIRTDGDYQHRKDVIEQAATYYDCNKTRAVLAACEDVPALVDAARQVLERDDLTVQQRREIADTFSTRAVSFGVAESVDVEKEP